MSFSSEKFLLILSAETLGGVAAFRLANYLWYYSVNYSVDHLENFQNLPCAFLYKVLFFILLL